MLLAWVRLAKVRCLSLGAKESTHALRWRAALHGFDQPCLKRNRPGGGASTAAAPQLPEVVGRKAASDDEYTLPAERRERLQSGASQLDWTQ